MIFNLVSSPRNVSTALMYSFYHRGDMMVFDEPYYGYYLNETGFDHPGKKEIIESMELDVKVIDETIAQEAKQSHVFVKNMAHHYLEFNLPVEENYIHLFLIRDPARIIKSFSKVIKNPTLNDIGVKRQFELLEYAKENHLKFMIIDSMDLLVDPPKHMQELCDTLGLEYLENMVKWEAGPISADGIWANYWYDVVHSLGGFEPLVPEPIVLEPQYHSLMEEAQFYFNILSKDKISF